MSHEEILKNILIKKEISIKDRIKFRTILDVLNSIFTNKNYISTLKIGYKLNDQQQVWFPNIIPDNKKDIEIKNGYCNYMSKNWDYVFQYNENKTYEKRKNFGEKLQKNRIQFLTFAKINEKEKGIGYHFIGIFLFDKFEDKECKTMSYKKISDIYKIIY